MKKGAYAVPFLKKANHAMILSDIKKYLLTNKQITLGELCIHFDSEPDAMRGHGDL